METGTFKIEERLTCGELCEYIHETVMDYMGRSFYAMSYYDIYNTAELELEFTTPCGGIIYVTLWNGGGGEVYVVTENRDGEGDFTNLRAMLTRELPTYDEWKDAQRGAVAAQEEDREEIRYWQEEAVRSYAY